MAAAVHAARESETPRAVLAVAGKEKSPLYGLGFRGTGVQHAALNLKQAPVRERPVQYLELSMQPLSARSFPQASLGCLGGFEGT